MEKKFYLQPVGRNGEYWVWQVLDTFEQYGQEVCRCLCVADEKYPIVSQEDAPFEATFSKEALNNWRFIPVNN